MSKTKIIIAIIIAAAIAVTYSFYDKTNNESTSITAEVKKGTFINEVVTSGEIQSSSLTKIKGPSNLRKFKI